MKHQPRKVQRGFTLMEMLTAVTLVGLLIASVSPAVGNFPIKAKLAATMVNARVVQSVVVGYAADHNGQLPTSRAQYASSSAYKRLANPFDTNKQGVGSWGNPAGASPEDNSAPTAPVAIWNVDPQTLIMADTAGVVFYVPYRNEAEARAGANSLPIGGDSGSQGYTTYTIQAMASLDTGGIVTPYADSRVTDW